MSGSVGLEASAYRFWGIAFALAGTVSFAFRPVLIKLGYANHPVSATTLLFLRMTLSLPFFFAMAWWMNNDRTAAAISRRDWLGIVGLGFLGYYFASLLDFLGLQYVSAGVGRLIMFLYPTLVVILSAVFLKKHPTPRELAALAITYTGIALVLSSQIASAPESRAFVFGALLIFASAMCYAVYLVTGSQLVKRVGSVRFTAYTMIVSTVPAVLQFLILESPAALELPATLWWIAIALATLCTVLADFVLLEGALSMLQIFGGASVISGVLLVSLKRN